MSNVIVELFSKSGMNIREFATAAGLKYSTAHDIVTGKANLENIGAGTFVRIAHVFNTTADALLCGVTEDMSSLSPDERMLINLFRNMDSHHRELIIENARSFAGFSKRDGDGDSEDVERTEHALR